jgi:hypothetical protein
VQFLDSLFVNFHHNRISDEVELLDHAGFLAILVKLLVVIEIHKNGHSFESIENRAVTLSFGKTKCQSGSFFANHEIILGGVDVLDILKLEAGKFIFYRMPDKNAVVLPGNLLDERLYFFQAWGATEHPWRYFVKFVHGVKLDFRFI